MLDMDIVVKMTKHQKSIGYLRKSTCSGLTLIELVIVIAIIGVLSRVALPAYQGYIEKGNLSVAVSDITAIALKAKFYYLESEKYPNNLGEIGEAGNLDPWGNPYQYLNLFNKKGKGGNRKDKKLNPLNSDFDLYSMGKDGATHTQISIGAGRDDIIRANDGSFIDKAEKY